MNKKVLLRAIILCWGALIVCFLIKLFGGNWFCIMAESSVCSFIDEHIILNYSIRYIMNLVSCYVYYLAVTKHVKFNLKENIISIASISACWALKVVFEKQAIWDFEHSRLIEIYDELKYKLTKLSV